MKRTETYKLREEPESKNFSTGACSPFPTMPSIYLGKPRAHLRVRGNVEGRAGVTFMAGSGGHPSAQHMAQSFGSSESWRDSRHA